MALTKDCHTIEFGVPEGNTLVAYPVGATEQLYSGAVALLSAAGFLKNAATPLSTDVVVGIIGDPAGGTQVQTGPGILGGATNGAVWVNVRTGSFFLQGGSGADALSAATNGKVVYYHGENNSGPVIDATGAGTKPVAGIQFPQDPGIAGTVTPGAAYWPIKLNEVGGP
jgi:hypothetical protein